MRRALPARLAAGVAVIALAAGLLASGGADAQDMQIIQLQHRLAEEILPVVQPLVEPGGAITGTGNLLIVRTSAGNFAQVQQAVAALDRAPRQLLISVDQAGLVRDESTRVRGSATVGSGDVQVGVNRPPGADSGVQVQAEARTGQTGSSNVSSVRALEGMEAYIAIGQSRPVSTTDVTAGWHGPQVTQSTQYRAASSGFYATAQVSGERVTLEISPQQQAFRSRATIDTQGLVTTVSGPLGAWIEIGAVREQSSGSAGGLLRWGARSADSQYTVRVKVEEIP